jgi:hypothetical protein
MTNHESRIDIGNEHQRLLPHPMGAKINSRKQSQYTDIIDVFQEQNASILYIECNFITDLG